MKKFLSCLFAVIYLCQSLAISQENKYLHPASPDAVQWFKDAKFGIFIHLGLYSLLEGSYNGETMPYKGPKHPEGNSWYAEWIEQKLDIPDSVYRKLPKNFTLKNFNADDWIRKIKDAGAKYFVITAKHHEGFALWDSKYSDYDLSMTPLKKRDILKELVTACKKYGLKYGFYYSHWQDWEDPFGGKPGNRKQPTDAEFDLYWHRKCLPQVAELIQRYDPDILWFDTWESANANKYITVSRRDELIAMIRKMSNKCLVNGRILFSNPGKNIDLIEMMDNEYPDKALSIPWQTPATMQHSWGFHAKDYNWKSSNAMLRYLVTNISKGGNYLVNIGPKADGAFPLPADQRLQEMGAWIHSNEEAIYHTQTDTITGLPSGIIASQKTAHGKKYHFLYLTEPSISGDVTVDLPFANIGNITQIDLNRPIAFKENQGKTVLTIPKSEKYDCAIRVLRIEEK